jgi:hypothetical protein
MSNILFKILCLKTTLRSGADLKSGQVNLEQRDNDENHAQNETDTVDKLFCLFFLYGEQTSY